MQTCPGFFLKFLLECPRNLFSEITLNMSHSRMYQRRQKLLQYAVDINDPADSVCTIVYVCVLIILFDLTAMLWR